MCWVYYEKVENSSFRTRDCIAQIQFNCTHLNVSYWSRTFFRIFVRKKNENKSWRHNSILPTHTHTHALKGSTWHLHAHQKNSPPPEGKIRSTAAVSTAAAVGTIVRAIQNHAYKFTPTHTWKRMMREACARDFIVVSNRTRETPSPFRRFFVFLWISAAHSLSRCVVALNFRKTMHTKQFPAISLFFLFCVFVCDFCTVILSSFRSIHRTFFALSYYLSPLPKDFYN